MSSSKFLFNSHLNCTINYSDNELFFSLVDYRNNYFTSDNPNKVVEFYNGFNNREQLIEWMRKRPKGVYGIHEIEGEKNIIVVIPTVYFNGKYAKNCRNTIFKGLHIIFVESGIDFYFNYAHNCNVGIKKAMEYNPKWVVISNDDIDSNFTSSNLKSELSKIDNKIFNVVLNKKGIQNSSQVSISSFTPLGLLTFNFFNSLRLYFVIKKLQNLLIPMKLSQNFNNKYFILGFWKNVLKPFINRIYTFYNFEAFGIFSSIWLKNRLGLFDETYINANEDHEVSIHLSLEKEKIAWIEYGIEGVGGASLGINLQRNLRTIASDCYLNEKIDEGLLNQINWR